MSDPNPPRRLGITPFERSMIKDHLDRFDLKSTVDADGDFRVEFAASEETGVDITFWLTAEGTNEDIFVVRAIGNVAVPKTIWPQVVWACNQWNLEKRYPKAYLMLPPNTDELFGQVHLEGQFPLSAGVTQPILDEFLTTIISTSFAFWEWVAENGVLDEGDGSEPASND